MLKRLFIAFQFVLYCFYFLCAFISLLTVPWLVVCSVEVFHGKMEYLFDFYACLVCVLILILPHFINLLSWIITGKQLIRLEHDSMD